MSAYVDDAPAADGRIVELAKQTTSRLEVLWDEVGYTSEEKRRQMQGLVDGFQTLCENKEKQEEGVKSQFVTSIADAKDRIKTARKKLGQEHTEDSSTDDMSLTDQLAYYEMEADAIKKMCKAQQEKFEKLSEELVHMSMVLGDDSDAVLAEWRDLESSLTNERLQAFKDKKTELNKATEDRMQTVASLVSTVQDLMEELKIPAATALDNRILGSLAIPSSTGVPVLQTTERTASSVGIDRAALDELTAKHEELITQRNTRREKLEKMGEEILDLWQQLDIGKDEQDVFAKSVDGMGLQTLEAGETELNRLRKLKLEKMGELVLASRAKIRELWDEIGYSETERLAFKPMLVTEEGFTDELLQQHTQEADKLATKFETMKHILEKIEERETLVEQRIEYETSTKDPSRLRPKGSQQERREQRRRLQEELEAEKRIKNRLPMLTSSLSKTIPQWENAQDSVFLYKGERYLDTLQRSEDEYLALKDQIKAAKAATKKEELRKHAMASPAPKSLNSVALGRGETPRSTRKQPGSSRKAGPSSSIKAPRTPAHGHAGKTTQVPASKKSAPVGMTTPNPKTAGRNAPSSALSGKYNNQQVL
ncbi:unnamed protein product [Ectocarpus sp. 8 AP-2014]